MATHDYVIANGTGAAVRSDLNGALAAIVSQNSSASAPATTYAYMLWADTTAGIMKMRNSANNAWISLWELDGTFIASDISLAAGSAAAPSLFFTGDTNTGLFSPGADTVALATAGSNRLHITSAGLVGIGTIAPGVKVDILSDNNTSLASVLRVNSNNVAVNTSLAYDGLIGSGQLTVQAGTSSALIFGSNAAEKARIDSSGRLLVGTSTARTNFKIGANIYTGDKQLEIGPQAFQSFVSGGAAAGGPYFMLAHQRSGSVGGNTALVYNDEMGTVSFHGADGTNLVIGAAIRGEVDGTPGTNDMPGRLVFSVTEDGASSPTERMRIDNQGRTNILSGDLCLELHVTGSAGTVTALIDGRYSATNNTTGNGTRSFIVFTNGNVQNTNNSYGAISDVKLKENIIDANSQWDDLKSLQVRNYNFKEGQTHTQIGLVAQEVELVSPGLVSKSPDRDEDGNDLGTVTKSVNYSVLYMKAVKALQEAMERIEALEADVAQLKGE